MLTRIATLAAVFAAGLSPLLPLPAQTVSLDSHRTLGAPKTFRNLTLIPVYDLAAKPKGTYLTLDEGLQTKQVTVKESPDGGDVNTLYVSNVEP